MHKHHSWARSLALTFCLPLLAVGLAAGCGSDGSVEFDDDEPPDSSGTKGGSSGTSGAFGGGSNDAEPSDAALTPDSACAAQSAEATLVKRPVDIILVVDNSGSMTQEIVGVQNNINVNFATILQESGLDYRVIVVGRHGSATSTRSICIEAPLSGIPAGGCTPPPNQPVFSNRFFHYSVNVGSHNSVCRLLERFTGSADEFNLAPNGWGQWLREDAFKSFIVLSDDGVNCNFGGTSFNDGNNVASGTSSALAIDQALLALSPAQFGTEAERNYSWHSIIGTAANNPATAPWTAADPITTSECPSAADPGTGYQGLSIRTGGLRFPLCDTSSYDAVFQAIAEGVIAGAAVACEFAVPEPPEGQELDRDSLAVRYTPGGGGAAQEFDKAASAADCNANSFYLDGEMIHLCPATCEAVKGDDAAKVDVLFACVGAGGNVH